MYIDPGKQIVLMTQQFVFMLFCLVLGELVVQLTYVEFMLVTQLEFLSS